MPRVGSDLRATQDLADHKLLRGGSTTAASFGAEGGIPGRPGPVLRPCGGPARAWEPP